MSVAWLAGIRAVYKTCYSTVNVSGTRRVGGIVGKNDGVVQNCYSTAIVSGTEDVGGILGYLNGDNLQNCVSLGASVLRADNSVANTLGRVVGGHNMGALNNNKARSDMLAKNATGNRRCGG
ncbi:MAG: hypothetical protein RR902_05410 [Oscillospiraceae bacterium]